MVTEPLEPLEPADVAPAAPPPCVEVGEIDAPFLGFEDQKKKFQPPWPDLCILVGLF